MTQIYAVIPFLVGIIVSGAAHVYSRRRLSRVCVAAVGFAVCLIALQLLWRVTVPHEAAPKPFGFLKLSFDMAGFYATVWTLTYVPLLPVTATALWSWFRSGRRFLPEVLFLAVTVVTFAALSFFYDWAEVRFTFIYQPVVLLLLIALCAQDAPTLSLKKPRRWDLVSAGALGSAVLVAASVAVTPLAYYGTPTITGNPRRSWVVDAWRARPVDRFGFGPSPPANMYAHATIPPFGPYAARIVRSYVALRARQETRRSGVNSTRTGLGLSSTDSDCQKDQP
jgi:hypothetical protein